MKPVIWISLLIATASTQPAYAGLVNPMDSHDTANWYRADGWTNGSPFNVGWRNDHIEFSGGQISLTLDDTPCNIDTAQCSGKPYAGAEYRSNGFYGYGRYEVTMQAAVGAGVVSSFFTYTGPSDGNPHDEIDIEFLGKDTSRVQFNFFTQGTGGHEFSYDLGFDASAAMHDYAIEWRPGSIQWFVDHTLAHSYTGSTTPTTDGRIMMNLWAVDSSASAWAGDFNYTAPVQARYDSVAFTPLAELTPVPLPGSFLLLGSALLALVRIRAANIPVA